MFPRTYAHLAEVVDARPHEVTDECGVVLGNLPEFARVGAESFAAHDDAVGVLFHIALIAQYAVVIARATSIAGKACFVFALQPGIVAPTFIVVAPRSPARSLKNSLPTDFFFLGALAALSAFLSL